MDGFEKFIGKLISKGFEAFGRYYSSYKGIVTGNIDPNNLGGVSVLVPQVSGLNAHPQIAKAKGVWGGKGYGSNYTPQVGDLVRVSFEFGDPRYPMWEHGGYAHGDKPSLFTASTFGFITPGGHAILVDDLAKTITVSHAGGNKIILEEGKIKINGGNRGGLIDIDKLVDKVNRLEDKVQSHQHIYTLQGAQAFTLFDPSTNPPFTPTIISDIEDDNVLH